MGESMSDDGRAYAKGRESVGKCNRNIAIRVRKNIRVGVEVIPIGGLANTKPE